MAFMTEPTTAQVWSNPPVTPVRDMHTMYSGMERALARAHAEGSSFIVVYVGLSTLLEKSRVSGVEELLRRTAAAIQQNLGAGDMIGRAGDDGLVVMLPDSTRSQAVRLMMMAQKTLYDLLPPGLRDKASFSYGLTESIGQMDSGGDAMRRLVAQAAGDMTSCLERCQNG